MKSPPKAPRPPVDGAAGAGSASSSSDGSEATRGEAERRDERRRRAWLVEYVRGRGDPDVTRSRPPDMSAVRYAAHRLIDVANDPGRAHRAIDSAVAERVGWADRDHGAAS